MKASSIAQPAVHTNTTPEASSRMPRPGTRQQTQQSSDPQPDTLRDEMGPGDVSSLHTRSSLRQGLRHKH